MNKIKDISYIRKQTGESLSVCKELYEKNGCDLKLTIQEIDLKQYSEKKKQIEKTKKFDVEKLKQEADKRERNRKITIIVLRVVFSILFFALLIYLFYRTVNVDNPLWIILYAPILAIVFIIFLKLCLPKKVWKAMQVNEDKFRTNDLKRDTSKKGRKRKSNSILGGALTVLSVLVGKKTRNRYANGRRRAKGITQYNTADFTKKDFWE